MDQRKKQDAHQRGRWAVRLLQAQLALNSLGTRYVTPTGADSWPARLIHAGGVLIGVSGVVLATWLRRRL